MKVKQHLAGRWNKQYSSASGMVGWLAGERMVRQHRPETAWTISLLEMQPTDAVLEVGFGAGQGIKLAAEKACDGRVMGIDLSEVMVRVAAASVNPLDYKRRLGLTKDYYPVHFPGLIGVDMAGTVIKIGLGAEGF